jgi:hypothetical protein
MTFTRSAQGISNYRHFYKVELIAYIEGKPGEDITFDEMYYQAILPKFVNAKTIKIKPVGSKLDALEYFQLISNQRNSNSIVIVDKDLYGISASVVASNQLLITYGYSWENDFWTAQLCDEVVQLLTVGQRSDMPPISVSIAKTMRRVLKISAIDAAIQSNADTLLPKNGKYCGIDLSFREPYLVSSTEYRRHAQSARLKGFFSCQVALSIYHSAVRGAPCKAIQGHLWEHICITIISRRYKSITKNKSAPVDIIKNLAFSVFRLQPEDYLDPSCVEHFKQQFSRLGYQSSQETPPN